MNIIPQLAKEANVTSLEEFIKDDDWVFEQKADGARILLCYTNGHLPIALNRRGDAYAKKLPKSILDFRPPEGGLEFILDGELVGDTFWVFDIPKIGFGEIGKAFGGTSDIAKWSLTYRRKTLEGLLQAWEEYGFEHPFKLLPQARTRDEKLKLSEDAMNNNLEGLVMKLKDAPYRSGQRTHEWVKVKFFSTADVFVTAVRDDGKESVRLGVMNGDAIQDVGRASLIGKEKNGPIELGDTIEVKYLYLGANDRLYQPTILRKRDDKLMIDCTNDQFKRVNKEVLEEL